MAHAFVNRLLSPREQQLRCIDLHRAIDEWQYAKTHAKHAGVEVDKVLGGMDLETAVMDEELRKGGKAAPTKDAREVKGKRGEWHVSERRESREERWQGAAGMTEADNKQRGMASDGKKRETGENAKGSMANFRPYDQVHNSPSVFPSTAGSNDKHLAVEVKAKSLATLYKKVKQMKQARLRDKNEGQAEPVREPSLPGCIHLPLSSKKQRLESDETKSQGVPARVPFAQGKTDNSHGQQEIESLRDPDGLLLDQETRGLPLKIQSQHQSDTRYCGENGVAETKEDESLRAGDAELSPSASDLTQGFMEGPLWANAGKKSEDDQFVPRSLPMSDPEKQDENTAEPIVENYLDPANKQTATAEIKSLDGPHGSLRPTGAEDSLSRHSEHSKPADTARDDSVTELVGQLDDQGSHKTDAWRDAINRPTESFEQDTRPSESSQMKPLMRSTLGVEEPEHSDLPLETHSVQKSVQNISPASLERSSPTVAGDMGLLASANTEVEQASFADASHSVQSRATNPEVATEAQSSSIPTTPNPEISAPTADSSILPHEEIRAREPTIARRRREWESASPTAVMCIKAKSNWRFVINSGSNRKALSIFAKARDLLIREEVSCDWETGMTLTTNMEQKLERLGLQAVVLADRGQIKLSFLEDHPFGAKWTHEASPVAGCESFRKPVPELQSASILANLRRALIQDPDPRRTQSVSLDKDPTNIDHKAPTDNAIWEVAEKSDGQGEPDVIQSERLREECSPETEQELTSKLLRPEKGSDFIAPDDGTTTEIREQTVKLVIDAVEGKEEVTLKHVVQPNVHLYEGIEDRMGEKQDSPGPLLDTAICGDRNATSDLVTRFEELKDRGHWLFRMPVLEYKKFEFWRTKGSNLLKAIGNSHEDVAKIQVQLRHFEGKAIEYFGLPHQASLPVLEEAGMHLIKPCKLSNLQRCKHDRLARWRLRDLADAAGPHATSRLATSATEEEIDFAEQAELYFALDNEPFRDGRVLLREAKQRVSKEQIQPVKRARKKSGPVSYGEALLAADREPTLEIGEGEENDDGPRELEAEPARPASPRERREVRATWDSKNQRWRDFRYADEPNNSQDRGLIEANDVVKWDGKTGLRGKSSALKDRPISESKDHALERFEEADAQLRRVAQFVAGRQVFPLFLYTLAIR